MDTINKAAFAKFPVLKTKRLTLRDICPSDAQALFEMQSDPLIFRYIAKDLHRSLDETKAQIDYLAEAYQKQEMLCWAATIRDSQSIIGTCGFNRIEYAHRRAEIGGSLSPKYWGARVALEAIRAILDYGFGTMSLHAIEAKVDPANRSVLALFKHFGFVQEGYFKKRMLYADKWYDMAVYTLFAEAYLSER